MRGNRQRGLPQQLQAPLQPQLPVPALSNARGFNLGPFPTSSCYDPCPDGASEQVPEYIPYLFTPYYKRVIVPGRGADSLFNVCLPDYKGGYCKTWWFVKCFGYDVVIDTTEEPPPLPDEVSPFGVPYSMLKLEVIGTEYGRFQARFVLDIGSRIDVSIGAYQRLEAHVLVPDFEKYKEEGGFVSDNPPYNLQDFRAKSLVVPSAVGVEALGGFANGRFTQSLYLESTDQPSQTMEIPAAAKSVHVMSSDPTATIQLTFLSPLGTVVAAIEAAPGDHVVLPDNADRVIASIGGGGTGPLVATLIFHLDV